MAAPAARSGFSFGKFLLYLLLIVLALGALYFAVVLNWSYSSGERAGWVQKFSNKGWLCKTWEGEIALVSMPGAIPEKFHFTVTDDAVAEQINKQMGRRVALHYEQKVGLPTSCFGETRYFVTRVSPVEELPAPPGVVVPAPVRPATPGAESPAAVPPVVPAPSAPQGGSTPGLPSMPAPVPEPKS
jgi:hypothetical protein